MLVDGGNRLFDALNHNWEPQLVIAYRSDKSSADFIRFWQIV